MLVEARLPDLFTDIARGVWSLSVAGTHVVGAGGDAILQLIEDLGAGLMRTLSLWPRLGNKLVDFLLFCPPSE